MGRYITSHRLPLESPPSGLYAVDGDLYIHHYGNKKAQVWLREGDQWMGNISDGHHHPLLPDYRLFVADENAVDLQGEDSWQPEEGCMATGRSVHDIGLWVGAVGSEPAMELQRHQINHQRRAAKMAWRIEITILAQ
ncbi:hypothetical protein EDD15DRAFT_2204764 [Pisolithus albus]|nr:hypothetical protein EDD15DRAFT_2204764 [Pisolithus albus]